MSKLEQFGLASGIIGLIADLIGLTTFVLGFWGFEQSDSSGVSMGVLFRIATIFVIFYGWIVISWILVRRSYVKRNKRQKYNFNASVNQSVDSLQVFIAPILILWALSLFTWVWDLDTYAEDAQIEATRVAIVMLTPTSTPSALYKPTPYIPRTVEQIAKETRGIGLAKFAFFGTIFGLPLGFLLYMMVNFLITASIINLMPVVYPDMARFISTSDKIKPNV